MEYYMAVTSKENFYRVDVSDITDYKVRMSTMRKRQDSFGSQNVDINDYILSPAGLEGLVLSLYFILIPYMIGALFLFVFIAQVRFEKFLQLDLASLFVIWAIGYEVLALIILIIIFISYLNFLKKNMKNS